MDTALIDIQRKKQATRLPNKVGGLLDRRWFLKKQKEVLEAALNEVKDEIETVEAALFLKYKIQDVSGARGTHCQASISTLVVPTAEDWSKIYTHILKGKGPARFDLLQKRLAVKAVKERWDDNVTVPGVGRFEKQRLSVTALK